MKKKNICKFVPHSISDTLNIECFIYESDPEVMKRKTLLHNHRVILVECGKGTFLFDDQEVPFNSGSLIFGFANETFSVISDEPCEYIYISFSGSRSETLLRRSGVHTHNRSFNGFDGLVPLVHGSLFLASQTNIDLAAESMLLYMFSRVTATATEQNKLINTIIETSEEHFSDPELSLSSIAQDISYNPKYLSHMFKEKMGISYSEYLRTLRIKYAISLFDRGIDSVKNVAFLSGFSDSLYFSTVFKKTVGISPKEYKNSHK